MSGERKDWDNFYQDVETKQEETTRVRERFHNWIRSAYIEPPILTRKAGTGGAWYESDETNLMWSAFCGALNCEPDGDRSEAVE